MKKIALCYLVALLTGMLSFIGCKKNVDEPTVVPSLHIAQMLQLPADASPALLSTTNNLRTQLQQQDFSGEFLRLHGQPLWNKAIKKGKTADRYTLYVPTQLPGQNSISSFFTVRYQNGQFTYRLYPRAAIASGLHGLHNWQLAYWFARLEAKALGKNNIQVAWLNPKAISLEKSGHYFGVVHPTVKGGGTQDVTVMASDYTVNDDDEDCCIEIWNNPDGDIGNDNGDEYYLHDDCSECAEEEDEIEDELVDGGGGCPWYNPQCNAVTGGGGDSNTDTSIVYVNEPDINLDGLSLICKSSFKFTKYIDVTNGVGGWQVAGTKDIHMNIVDLVTRKAVRLTLPTMYFGLPLIRASGEYFSTKTAAEIAADAVEWAERAVMDRYFALGGTLDIVGMTLYFRQKINERMQQKSGSASLIPGSNITVTEYGTASYPWPIIGC